MEDVLVGVRGLGQGHQAPLQAALEDGQGLCRAMLPLSRLRGPIRGLSRLIAVEPQEIREQRGTRGAVAVPVVEDGVHVPLHNLCRQAERHLNGADLGSHR